MASIFSLEGTRPTGVRLWTPQGRPRSLGDGARLWVANAMPAGLGNPISAWFGRQSLPVAVGSSIALSIGVGFVVSSVFLKLLGKSSSSRGMAGISDLRCVDGTFRVVQSPQAAKGTYLFYETSSSSKSVGTITAPNLVKAKAQLRAKCPHIKFKAPARKRRG